MAQDLAALQAQVEQLKRDYTALTNKPAALFDVSNPIKAAAAVKSLTDQIELATQRAARLEEGFGGIFDEVTAIVAELYKTQQPIDLASKAMKGIRNVTEKLKYDQQGISEMSLKELKNSQKKLESLQEQVRTQANMFIISKGLQNSSGLQLENYLNASIAMGSITEEQAAMVRGAKEGFTVFLKTNDELSKRLKLEKKVQSDLGITGGLLKGISKIPILGDMFDASDAVEEMETHLRGGGTATQALSIGLKNVKGQIIDGLLNPANLIVGAFTLMVEVFKRVDKGVGELAKGFNMTYSDALKTRQELTQIAALSNDAAVNTRGLQESMMAIGQTLGSNARLNEKDLVFMTKMRERAGFTNEELVEMQKLTFATGGTLEKNTENLLFAVKTTGLNNKVLLNEKDIMRDVAKASNAVKLSVVGGAEGLGRAAAQAKALGMNLNQLDGIASGLLDFESSINAELEAQLLTGKDINLGQARLYALNNDMEGLSREIAKNAGTAADFNKMNRLQQDAIAKAVGMTREELATTLTDQKALQGLSGKAAEDAKKALAGARARGMTEEEIREKGIKDLMSQQSIQEKFNQTMEKLQDIIGNLVNGPFGLFLEGLSKGLDYIGKIFAKFGQISGIIKGFLGDKVGDVLGGVASIATIGTLIALVTKSMLKGTIFNPMVVTSVGGGAGGADGGASKGISSILGPSSGTGIGKMFQAGGKLSKFGKVAKAGGYMSLLSAGMDLTTNLMDDKRSTGNAVAKTVDQNKFTALGALIGSIFGGVGAIPGAAIGGVLDWALGDKTQIVKDGVIGPDGGLKVSGKKGTFSLDKNDTVIAGTDLNKPKSGTQTDNSSMISELREIKNILRKTLDVNIEIARGVMASGIGSALAMSLDVGKLGTVIGTNTYKVQ